MKKHLYRFVARPNDEFSHLSDSFTNKSACFAAARKYIHEHHFGYGYQSFFYVKDYCDDGFNPVVSDLFVLNDNCRNFRQVVWF